MNNIEEQIKNILSSNQYTAELAQKLTANNIKLLGNFIYLNFPESFDSPHMKKHFDRESAGSIWSIPKDSVVKLILKTIAKNKPTFQGQEGPAFKIKWINQQAEENIGFDSLIKLDPSDSSVSQEDDLERFGMVDRVKDWSKISDVVRQNNYDLVTQDGNVYTEKDLNDNQPAFIKQKITVKKGDKMSNPTKFYNLVVAKIGEVEDGEGQQKSLLSLMTVFPGINPVDAGGKDITNKKDLAAAGYALLKSGSQQTLQESLVYKRMCALAGILK